MILVHQPHFVRYIDIVRRLIGEHLELQDYHRLQCEFCSFQKDKQTPKFIIRLMRFLVPNPLFRVMFDSLTVLSWLDPWFVHFFAKK